VISARNLSAVVWPNLLLSRFSCSENRGITDVCAAPRDAETRGGRWRRAAGRAGSLLPCWRRGYRHTCRLAARQQFSLPADLSPPPQPLHHRHTRHSLTNATCSCCLRRAAYTSQHYPPSACRACPPHLCPFIPATRHTCLPPHLPLCLLHTLSLHSMATACHLPSTFLPSHCKLLSLPAAFTNTTALSVSSCPHHAYIGGFHGDSGVLSTMGLGWHGQ